MDTSQSIECIEKAIAEFKAGRMVILVDDESRENEGDLCMAAEKVTPEAINFMAKYGRGLICMPMEPDQVKRLGLHMMTEKNRAPLGTAFTVSIEARTGVTTGISAADRARTIRVAASPDATPDDVVSPGHVFPLRAREGGALVRAGQTEGCVDLARLAGLIPAGVVCEIMNDDGTMARRPDLEVFAKEHGLHICSVADLIRYRLQRESMVVRAAEAGLPTAFGNFDTVAYQTLIDNSVHVAMVKGDVTQGDVLVRVHSKCLTGDVFGSQRCDCGPQLQAALQKIDEAGAGVLLYLDQEGRGIGLVNKLRAYVLQDQGHDTVEANELLGFKGDLRDYGIGAQILRDLGVRRMKLMTNNPRKVVGLEAYGLQIVGRVPLEIPPTHENVDYLRTKRDRMGHLLSVVDPDTKKVADGESD